MDWAQKRVLVTGAGGLIGSHLAEKLVKLGAQVTALVRYNSRGANGWLDVSEFRDNIEITAGDVTDPNCIKKVTSGKEVIFHLAALIGIPYSYHAPISYVRTNIEGTLNVMQGAMDAGAERVIHTSTSEVYGTAQSIPIKENYPLQGQSPYSATKIGADKLVEAFQRSFELPAVTVRPFNTYGPRQSLRAVIPTIISQCLAGNKVSLGHLSPTRDFNYVSDTAEGFIMCAESEQAIGRTVNIGSGHEISIGDLAEKIADLMGVSVEIVSAAERSRPEKSEVERLYASNELARELTGWTPRHSLTEGLEKTITWMRENFDKRGVSGYVI